MKTILVPTDFSKNALNAVKYAIAFAEDTKSKVILFHTYTSPTRELNIPFSDIHLGKQDAIQGAEKKMKKLIDSLLKLFPNRKVTFEIQSGIASDNIVEYASQTNAWLIIMGSTGEGAIVRTLIGSTTENVIVDARCNILAVPSKAKFKGIYKVAIATGIENADFEVIDEAVLFAKQLQAEITFIHIQDLEIFDAENVLKKMVVKIKKHVKYKKISFYEDNGFDVIKGLEDYIKKNKPDILSMITHSRKFPETIWKTSWTNKMANHTTIPLLILHRIKVD